MTPTALEPLRFPISGSVSACSADSNHNAQWALQPRTIPRSRLRFLEQQQVESTVLFHLPGHGPGRIARSQEHVHPPRPFQSRARILHGDKPLHPLPTRHLPLSTTGFRLSRNATPPGGNHC